MNPRFYLAALLGLACHHPSSVSAVERVVVLTNGNVLQGEVKQLANRVVVTTKNSQLHLSRDDVEMVKSSLGEVYLDKAGKLSTASTASRAQLVRWCLRYQLREEAARELERLRHYHPDYPSLDALERLVREPIRDQAGQAMLPSKSPIHQDAQFAKQHLGSLSRQSLSEFVRTIQPLLTNKCAQAGCHGMAGDSTYTLMASSLGRAPQSITYRNLGATLRRIGDYPTEQTLLWMSARKPHGTLKQAALTPSELQKLLAWIHSVNADRGIIEGTTRVVLANAEVDATEAEDPFDPDKFNQMAHDTDDRLSDVSDVGRENAETEPDLAPAP